MGLTVSALQAAYGAFYQKGSQNEKNLIQKVYKGAEFDSLFTPMYTTDTIIRNVAVRTSPMLQAFQKAFTAAGGVSLLPRPIDLYHIKADDSIFSSDVEDTYVGFLADDNAAHKDWPIVRYWIEQLFFKQFVEDIDNNAFGAVLVNPTAGTAGAASASMNGFGKIIKNLVAASLTNVITVGAVPTDPTLMVEYIETMVAAIPAHIRKLPMDIAVAPALESRYKVGMRAKYGLLVQYQQSNIASVMDYPNIQLKGYNAMVGKNKIFITPKGNLLLGIKRNPSLVEFGLNGTREVLASHDHWRGYGVIDADYFYHNDVENV